MEPAPAALEQRTPAVEPDPPADDRAEQVAERAGNRDREVRRKASADVCAEERDACAEGTGCYRAAVHHHELARSGKDRIDEHEDEHRVEAVVADERRHRSGEAR